MQFTEKGLAIQKELDRIRLKIPMTLETLREIRISLSTVFDEGAAYAIEKRLASKKPED